MYILCLSLRFLFLMLQKTGVHGTSVYSQHPHTQVAPKSFPYSPLFRLYLSREARSQLQHFLLPGQYVSISDYLSLSRGQDRVHAARNSFLSCHFTPTITRALSGRHSRNNNGKASPIETHTQKRAFGHTEACVRTSHLNSQS